MPDLETTLADDRKNAPVVRLAVFRNLRLESDNFFIKPPCQSTLRCRARVASRDQIPPPTKMRKTKQQNMAKSVRASLTMYQKPRLARNNSGTFLVAIAVVITISKGIDAILVPSPSTSRKPQRTSNVPTKCAVKYGCENPILVKRVTPMFGSMYFRMPYVKKISPTAIRTSNTLRGPSLGSKRNLRIVFKRSPQPALFSMISLLCEDAPGSTAPSNAGARAT